MFRLDEEGIPFFHFYLTQSNPSYYYYDHGIIIRFDPDEVAPLSEGYVDVKVTYTKINKKRNDLTTPAPSVPGHDYVTKSHIENEFTGYDYGNIYWLTGKSGSKWSILFISIMPQIRKRLFIKKVPSITCEQNTLIQP